MKRRQYSTQLYSVRKDVECTFHILNGRFWVLRGVSLTTIKRAPTPFSTTSCILHDKLLAMNGLDDLESDIDWCGEDEEEFRIQETSRASLATLCDVPA